jgi:hypothetical protein
MGFTTTGAPAYTTAQTNPLSLTTAGALRVDSSAVTQPVSGTFWQATQPVSGTFWQATQPVSGTVTANQGGAPWTATIQQGGNSAVVKAASTAAAAADPSLVVNISPNSPAMAMTQSGVWTVQPGNTANTTPWLATINQGGNSAVVKAASTAAAAADPSLVVNISPNSPPMAMTQSGAWTVTANQGGAWSVSQSGAPWNFQGDIGSGTADSGNPVKIGGIAQTGNPTAVSLGQRVSASFDKVGRQVCIGAVRLTKAVQKTSITVATETTVVTAGGTNIFNDVYAIIVTNKSATGVSVDFKDATAGTTRMTLYAPATDTRGFTVPVDSAMVQAVSNNNWTATVSSAVTSIEITMLYVSNL